MTRNISKVFYGARRKYHPYDRQTVKRVSFLEDLFLLRGLNRRPRIVQGGSQYYLPLIYTIHYLLINSQSEYLKSNMPKSQSSPTFTWCFTWNNYSDDDHGALVSKLEEHCKYAVVGKEVGDSGTPHLQGYLSLKKRQRLTALKKVFGTNIHFENARGSAEQNYKYCTKDGDFIEVGTLPTTHKDSLAALTQAIENGAPISEVAAMDGPTYVRNYRGLANYASLQVEDYTHFETRGIWLYGPPGVGKSHHARQFADAVGGLYIKQQNKWFDGYNGEDVILLDDLDTPMLSHHLKIWADKYACNGEIKGGTVKLRHKYFIVTSNYMPIDLWPCGPDDPITNKSLLDAIMRRFVQIRVSAKTESVPRLTKLIHEPRDD